MDRDDYDYDDYDDEDDYCWGGGGAAPNIPKPVFPFPLGGSKAQGTPKVPEEYDENYWGPIDPTAKSGTSKIAPVKKVNDDDDDEDLWGPIHPTAKAGSSKNTATSTTATKNVFIPKKPIITNRTAVDKIPFEIYYDVKSLGSWIYHTWKEETATAGLRTPCPERLYSRLAKAFEECGNPYWLGLHVCSHAYDFFQYKFSKSKPLAYEVLNLLKTWLKSLPEERLIKLKAKHLTKHVQIHALELTIAQKNVQTAKLMAELFSLIEIKTDAIARIKELCQDRYFKEACLLATTLNLYDDFTIHDFLVPLFLQDREAVFDEYLTNAKKKQKPFLLFVDEWLGAVSSSYEASNYAREHNVDNVQYAKLDMKPLTKFVDRLAAKFNIECPNAKQKHCGSVLRHLIYRKYEDTNSTMNDAGFDELLDSAVGSDPELWDQALNHLKSAGDLDTAARFALRKSLPLTQIPSDIKRIMKQLDPSVPFMEPQQQMIEEDWDTGEVRVIQPGESTQNEIAMVQGSPKRQRTTSLYEIPNTVTVHFCDNGEKIDELLKQLKAMTPTGPRRLFTSFDCEWKPIMATRKGVALIQIGVGEEVYLVDTHTMKGIENPQEKRWVEMLEKYFNYPKIAKLGFSTAGDVQQLAATCPEWADMKNQLKRVLDLSKLAKLLVQHCPTFFPYLTVEADTGTDSENSPKINSLSDLVYACFGTKLDKTEQFTDWERRPLRKEQIQYAATDAYVLLDIFRFIQRNCNMLNIELDDFYGRVLT